MGGVSKSMRKILISIFSLIFTVSIFGTVSYAWFSIATTTIVYNVHIGITSESNFQISLDGLNYFDNLTNDDIINVIGDGLALRDVTSHDGLNFYYGGPSEFEEAGLNIDYLSIPLYFRTTEFERNVYLVDNVSKDIHFNKDIDGTYVISRGINWKADSTFIYGEDTLDIITAGERHLLFAADAIRIGFQEVKILDNLNDDRDPNELNNKIFDLSANPTRGYGTSYGSLDYYNVKHNSNFEPPTTIQNVVTELSTFNEYNPYIPLDDNSHILEMIQTNKVNQNGKPYYEGKVLLNIWLEGWDADCFDAIFRDIVTINLKFKSTRDVQNIEI